MKQEISYREEAQEKLLRGIGKLADAVKVTLGGAGRNVLISELHTEDVRVTKDGVSVAKQIELNDPSERQGANFLKKVALKTDSDVNDGTTTSIVLAQKLYELGIKMLKSDSNLNPIVLNKQIQKAIDKTIVAVEKKSKNIHSIDEITKVALTTSNHDEELSSLLAEAYSDIGLEGQILLQPSNSSKSFLETHKGYTFDSGLISEHFIDPTKTLRESKDPLILVTNIPIKGLSDFGDTQETNLVLNAVNNRKDLYIVCDEVDEAFVRLLVMKHKAEDWRVFLVKAPEYGERRVDALKDIATVVGAEFIDHSVYSTLPNLGDSHIGTCKKLETTGETTSIIGGGFVPEDLEVHVGVIEQKIEKADEYETEFLNKRLALLKKGICILKLGANSETEFQERFDRAKDSLNSIKAALESGVVAGGGIALRDVSTSTFADPKDKGEELIKEVIREPSVVILKNTGIPVDSKFFDLPENTGIDVISETQGNMFELGIVDSCKTVTTALKNAGSVVGTLLTTGCSIVNIHDDEKSSI